MSAPIQTEILMFQRCQQRKRFAMERKHPVPLLKENVVSIHAITLGYTTISLAANRYTYLRPDVKAQGHPIHGRRVVELRWR
ncbi:uncharacterized protein METZ01_LOCUS237392 [marine metagenome]|uniref:Uncharacterized protein n=1 Tax=marine metagenome TaxID=408172 RepID=A0A382HB36_9ZZZZ